jgi:hypothetical protein
VKIKVVQKFFVTKIQNPGGSSLIKVPTRDCLSLLYSAASNIYSREQPSLHMKVQCTVQQTVYTWSLTVYSALYIIHENAMNSVSRPAESHPPSKVCTSGLHRGEQKYYNKLSLLKLYDNLISCFFVLFLFSLFRFHFSHHTYQIGFKELLFGHF